MKTLPRFFRTFGRVAPVLVTGAALALAAPSAEAQTLITDFETSEGYATGAAGGQGGWVLSGGATNSFLINTTTAFTGTQSLSVGPNVTNNLTRAFIDGEQYDGFSLHFTSPDATHIANAMVMRFRIYLGTQDELVATNQSHMEFSLSYGATGAAPLALTYRIRTFVGSTTVFENANTMALPSAGLVDLDSWTKFSLVANTTARTVAVMVGTTQIASLNLGTYVTEDAGFYQMQFWGHTTPSGSGGALTYYDRIETQMAVPEAGSLALLSAGAFGVWVSTRRRRAA